MNAEVVRLKKILPRSFYVHKLRKLNEKAFDKVQQPLKIKTPKKTKKDDH